MLEENNGSFNSKKSYEKIWKHRSIKKCKYAYSRGRNLRINRKNGAGKTTLIKTILGLTEITDGEICFWEKSGKNNLRIYNRIGASLDFQGFYPELSAY